jgi:hypothetical protein
MIQSAKLGASFRDPSGFLFWREGILYRQVNRSYQESYDRLVNSGLYEALIKAGLLIAHEEVQVEPYDAESAYKIIKPEPVKFISYPYEWSFSQLKDAALATLKIQKKALDFGMSVKDSSAYNIQFHQGRPVLIDSLSFENYVPGKPWVAYRQFCQHFLAPLSLMARSDIRLGQLLRVYIDGVPLDLASKLLPKGSYLNFPILSHIHLHAIAQRRYSGSTIDKDRASAGMSKNAFLGLMDSLESGIRGLNWGMGGTEWGDYYDQHNYSQQGMEDKKKIVSEFLDQIRPQVVWDLGANVGLFSRLASDRGAFTVSFDVDPGAVEQNYREVRRRREEYLLPLTIDLTNPSANIGWHNQERLSLLARGPADATMALALIHHLAISNNVPLAQVRDFFHQAGKWLIIEFVPKSDSQVSRLLATREDIFPDYHQLAFAEVFAERFKIHAKRSIRDSEREIYLMEGKD